MAAASVCAVIAFSDQATAGEGEEEANLARPNIVELDLGSGVVGIGFERLLTPWLSVRTTFQLNRPWYTQLIHGEESDVIGFGGELRPFFFPMSTAGRGLYVSPFGRIAGIRAQDALPAEERGIGWSTGATLGWGFLFGDGRWLVRLGAGVQYWAFEVTGSGGQTTGVSGLYPDVDIILGFAF